MLFAACLPGQCQTFIDVLYQFIFKGNFSPKHRMSSFSTREFDSNASPYRMSTLNNCFFCENQGVYWSHKETQQVSVTLKVHRIAVNPVGY